MENSYPAEPATHSIAPDEAGQVADRSTARWFLPLLVVLFFGSGCAALIYEIVWFQLLQLVVGSSAVSLGGLLGVFMGGMCLGSLVLPRVISMRQHPLRIYAFLEAGIGVFGLLVMVLVPQVGRFYAAHSGSGLTGIVLRGVVCALCLLPPTVLMGATLPAISRWVETTPKGVSWLGFFYGGNIAGAMVGCLVAGFYLLRVHDMAVATYAAVVINGAVAAAAFFLARSNPYSGSAAEEEAGRGAGAATRQGTWLVCLAIGLSGLCALGAEVVWTRLLSLMLGATVYTFSIILAVFLVGLGIGSSVGSLIGKQVRRPHVALGVCQLLLTLAIAWSAYMLARSLPYWPINPSLSRSAWFNFQIDLLRCAWAILPAACLWGASFPLALAAASFGERDPGRLVGRIYAANTVGAIVGAIGCSIVLISWIGTQNIQRLLIGLSAVAAVLVLLPFRRTANAADGLPKGTNRIWVASWLLAAMVMAAGLAWKVPKLPWELVAYGRYLPTKIERGTVLYVGEGMNASVAVTELQNGIRTFHVSGKVEASTEPRDMRLQRMLGHIPALLHNKPKSVLVVGCGAGVTAGSFLEHPSVERVVICEIEPLVPKVVAQFFGEENHDVVNDPRVTVVYDDARHYVLTSQDKFDIITSDPIHPWVKGAATLYTKEYFELCKEHLNPGGLVTQWVPLYESNLAVVRSELGTFFDVFPNGTIWSNEDEIGQGYDVVLLGQAGKIQINLEEVQGRLGREDHQDVLQSLRQVGFRSSYSLLATYGGQASDLKPWLKYAQINRDRDLRLQYLAGMGLNFYEQDLIYTDMLLYRRFPEEIFSGSGVWKDALKKAIERPKAGK